MTGRDFLWCALNLVLDDEEALEDLCPGCRIQAEEPRCPVCGTQTGAGQRDANDSFDQARFERLRRGERV